MSGNALALAELDLSQPPQRPKGVTAKQWRHALLYPRCETAYQAALLAGYKPSTALARAGQLYKSVGVARAREAQERNRVDSARGLVGIGTAGLAKAAEDLGSLDPRDRLAVSIKCIEVGASLGENVETAGDADAHRRRQLRAMLLLVRLTEQRLSPTICSGFAARNRAARQKARGY